VLDHVYESQKLLLDTLKGHGKQFNAKSMISLCLAHKHFIAASAVCENLGAYVAALTHRLNNIKSTDTVPEISEYLLLQVDYICKLEEMTTVAPFGAAPKIQPNFRKDEMLYLVRNTAYFNISICLLMIIDRSLSGGIS